jgi:hypothetical protein
MIDRKRRKAIKPEFNKPNLFAPLSGPVVTHRTPERAFLMVVRDQMRVCKPEFNGFRLRAPHLHLMIRVAHHDETRSRHQD